MTHVNVRAEQSFAPISKEYHSGRHQHPDHLLSAIAFSCAALLTACGGGGGQTAEQPSEQALAAETWTACAKENGTCTLKGSQRVRYGVPGGYAYGTFTGSVVCSNSAFGDPFPGADKTCDISSKGVPAPAPAPAPATWNAAATENQPFTVSGTKTVRYGAGSTWVQKSVTGTGQCSNAFFGQDPMPGADKVCQVLSGTAAPAPAPAPTPSPAPSPTAAAVPTPVTIAGKAVVGQIVARAGQIIENVHVTTSSGSCIVVRGVGNVIIRNSEIGPCGQPGDPNTQGVEISNASNVTIERNVIHDVSSGVYASTSAHPIVMDRNYVYNVRGPLPRGQMIQMNNVSGGSSASKVTCNVSDAQPGVRYGVLHGNTTDGVEDHINMFQSPGLAAARTEIAFNRLRGGHKTSTSGSGFVLGDVGGGNVNAHHNTIVNVANVGAGIAGGTNISIDNNRIYQNKDAGIYVNLGLMVWGQAGAACTGGHTVRNNRVWTLNSLGAQNSYWNAGNCGAMTESGNTFVDTSLTPAIFDEVPAECR